MSGLCPHGFESRRRRSFYSSNGFVAEWSKALDSSSSLHLKAWVRIPPEPCFSKQQGLVAQWIARKTSNLKVAGSSPARVALLHKPWGISSIGRVRRSQRRGTGIETRILHAFAMCVLPWYSGYYSSLWHWQPGLESRWRHSFAHGWSSWL